MNVKNNIILSKGDSVNKKVNVNNIEPITNIKVVREKEPSETSEDVSISDVSSILEKHKKPKPPQRSERPKQKNNFNFSDYNSFSNPKKVRPVEEDYDIDSISEYSSSASGSDISGSSADSDESEKLSFKEQQKLKQDLLIKIQALEKKGFEFSKKFTMTSDYREMEFEYTKVKKFIESQGAVRFSRRCLMACVTGLEFLNKKFDPFAVKLDGWSENVMENIDDYDNIFEKLHEKYSGKAEIAPELELLLTLGGSAFMFHLTNTLLKTPSFESVNQIGQNSPTQQPGMNNNFMASMMGALNQNMKEMNNMNPQNNNQKPIFTNDLNKPSNQQDAGLPKPIETRFARKEMKGPSIDPNLFGNINNYAQPPPPIDFFDEDRFSVASSDDSDISSVSSVSKDSLRNTSETVKKLLINNNTKNTKNTKKGIELNIS